jgi:hypothetical protein
MMLVGGGWCFQAVQSGLGVQVVSGAFTGSLVRGDACCNDYRNHHYEQFPANTFEAAW